MTGLLCVRCGDTAASYYARVDTAGHVCIACILEEREIMRERVADLEAQIDAIRAIHAAH